MSINLPELEGTEAAVALPTGRRHSRVPGLDAIRATSGFQRGMLVAGALIVLFFTVVAVFAKLIAPYGFNDDRHGGKVFGRLVAPSSQHWMGTTSGGEDVYSRVVFGAQTAMEVIVLAVLLSIVVGVPLGLLSGYFGGWLDRVLVLVTDALFAFPSLLLAIIVSIAIAGGSSSATGGILSAAISITVVYVPQYFRVVRNATVAAREEPYVEAARTLGASPLAIMTRYIFGNVVQTVPVIATLNAGDAILTLAGLGFLGYGIDPSAGAEWGHDLSKAISDTSNGIWWTGVYPGVAIALLVVGVTLVGESLNDVLNPLLRTTRLKQVVLPSRRTGEPTQESA
ncbi:MAG: Dipeptide transport system permease protein DppC [Pseudonocardiales bacterium]|nr:Dipeptide transport system permease protein DppC [Pseudonocardiales bacterium]